MSRIRIKYEIQGNPHFAWADEMPNVLYIQSESIEHDNMRFFGLLFVLERDKVKNGNSTISVKKWIGFRNDGYVTSYYSKRSAKAFMSAMEVVENYNRLSDTKAESFQITSNLSAITNSFMGCSHWFRSILATVNDALVYTNDKKKVNEGIIDTAIMAQKELIENEFLIKTDGYFGKIGV